jgi:hypothetical protein
MTTHGNAGPNYCERRVHERAGGRIDSDRQPRVLDRRLGGRADGRAGGRDCQWAAGNPGRRAMTPANVGARCRANGRTRTGQWTSGKRTRPAGWLDGRAGGRRNISAGGGPGPPASRRRATGGRACAKNMLWPAPEDLPVHSLPHSRTLHFNKDGPSTYQNFQRNHKEMEVFLMLQIYLQ